MWPTIAAGAASVLGNIVGGVMNKSATDKANAQQRDLANQNMDMQREFAKNGIRWKVEDAVRSGVHPLYALGANTHSYSPVSVGTTADYSMGDAMKNIGQDISRSIQSTRTQREQELAKLQLTSARLDLQGKTLDNQIKASQLRKLNQVTTAMPGGTDGNFIPGQGNSPLVQEKPLERTVSQPGRLAQEAGWRPDVSYARTDTGLTPMVPESLSESMEDDFIGKILWRVRNQLVPNFTNKGAPSQSQLPKGATSWEYDFWSQEWRPIKGTPMSPFEKAKKYLRSMESDSAKKGRLQRNSRR